MTALLPIQELFEPLTPAQIQATLITVLQQLGLDTSSWQPGGAGRTFLAMNSQEDSTFTQLIAIINQGGFLDYAADPSVTPDPSINPAAPKFGWLDIIAQSRYNVFRTGATAALPTISLSNSLATATASFPPGTFHVRNTSNNQTYSNLVTVMVPANTATPGVAFAFAADVPGAAGSLATSAMLALVTTVSGVVATCTGSGTGTNAGSNQSVVTNCHNKLASLSPNGAGAAYEFFAVQTPVLTPIAGIATMLSQPIIKAKAVQDTINGIVQTIVSYANPATPVTVADLAVILQWLSNNCVPLGVVAVTTSNTVIQLDVVATLQVKKNSTNLDSQIIANALTGLGNYINTLPIGGFDFGSGSHFPGSGMEAALKDSDPNILGVTTITDLPCISTDVLQLVSVPASFTVVHQL